MTREQVSLVQQAFDSYQRDYYRTLVAGDIETLEERVQLQDALMRVLFEILGIDVRPQWDRA